MDAAWNVITEMGCDWCEHQCGERAGCGCADMVQRAIDAAVAAEREACAKIAAENTDFRMLQDFGMQSMCDQLCTNIATAIRARSN